MLYRLLAGAHFQDAPNAKPLEDGTIPQNGYGPGAIIDSPTDLVARFNSPDPNFPKKFERVADNPSHVTLRDQSTAPITNPYLRRHDETPEQFQARLVLQMQQMQAALGSAPAPQPSQQTATRQPVNTGRLEQLSVKELQTLCEEEEIDSKGSADKKELIRLIKASGL